MQCFFSNSDFDSERDQAEKRYPWLEPVWLGSIFPHSYGRNDIKNTDESYERLWYSRLSNSTRFSRLYEISSSYLSQSALKSVIEIEIHSAVFNRLHLLLFP